MTSRKTAILVLMFLFLFCQSCRATPTTTPRPVPPITPLPSPILESTKVDDTPTPQTISTTLPLSPVAGTSTSIAVQFLIDVSDSSSPSNCGHDQSALRAQIPQLLISIVSQIDVASNDIYLSVSPFGGGANTLQGLVGLNDWEPAGWFRGHGPDWFPNISILGDTKGASGDDYGGAISKATQSLTASPQKDKFLIIITDGSLYDPDDDEKATMDNLSKNVNPRVVILCSSKLRPAQKKFWFGTSLSSVAGAIPVYDAEKPFADWLPSLSNDVLGELFGARDLTPHWINDSQPLPLQGGIRQDIYVVSLNSQYKPDPPIGAGYVGNSFLDENVIVGCPSSYDLSVPSGFFGFYWVDTGPQKLSLNLSVRYPPTINDTGIEITVRAQPDEVFSVSKLIDMRSCYRVMMTTDSQSNNPDRSDDCGDSFCGDATYGWSASWSWSRPTGQLFDNAHMTFKLCLSNDADCEEPVGNIPFEVPAISQVVYRPPDSCSKPGTKKGLDYIILRFPYQYMPSVEPTVKLELAPNTKPDLASINATLTEELGYDSNGNYSCPQVEDTEGELTAPAGGTPEKLTSSRPYYYVVERTDNNMGEIELVVFRYVIEDCGFSGVSVNWDRSNNNLAAQFKYLLFFDQSNAPTITP